MPGLKLFDFIQDLEEVVTGIPPGRLPNFWLRGVQLPCVTVSVDAVNEDMVNRAEDSTNFRQPSKSGSFDEHSVYRCMSQGLGLGDFLLGVEQTKKRIQKGP